MGGDPFPRGVERLLSKQETQCLISIVSGWEIVLKPKLGLTAGDVESAIREMGALLLPIKFKHLAGLSDLATLTDHRDPFDRMLIAQALVEDVPIVTSDSRFSDYRGLRVVWD
jgi:PIN domain nuclease of toxin-antitoxin system